MENLTLCNILHLSSCVIILILFDDVLASHINYSLILEYLFLFAVGLVSSNLLNLGKFC